jgi:hypothetical protein
MVRCQLKLLIPILFMFSLNVFSQPIIIEVNGIKHSCTPLNNNGGTRIDCINLAYSGPFSRDEAQQLCQGAYDDMPARCALRAYRGSFTKEEAIRMCIRAKSEGPIDCFELAYSGPFTKEESLRLCSNNRASSRTAQCALDAYRGAYSKDEAIELCRGQQRLNREMLMNKDLIQDLVKEANLKAFRTNDYKE